jgi:hypothetical protein
MAECPFLDAYGEWIWRIGPPAVIRSTKSAVERTGHGRKKACRQAVMILQHENMRPNALELGFHEPSHINF